MESLSGAKAQVEWYRGYANCSSSQEIEASCFFMSLGDIKKQHPPFLIHRNNLFQQEEQKHV